MCTLPKASVVGVPLVLALALLGACSRTRAGSAPAPRATASVSAAAPPVVTTTPAVTAPPTTSTPGASAARPGSAVPPRPSGPPIVTARPARSLVDVLNKAGIACDGWQHYAQTSPAHDSGACFLHEGDGGARIVVATYGTAKQSAAAAKQAGSTAGASMVVGSTWTYACDSAALCRRIAGKVGGRLVRLPG